MPPPGFDYSELTHPVAGAIGRDHQQSQQPLPANTATGYVIAPGLTARASNSVTRRDQPSRRTLVMDSETGRECRLTRPKSNATSPHLSRD